MFERWKPEGRQVRVVQPVLAVVLHAGLISLALGTRPVSTGTVVEPIPLPPLPVYTIGTPEPEVGLTDGTGDVRVVSPPIELPGSLPGIEALPPGAQLGAPPPLDPKAFVNRPDSDSRGSPVRTVGEVSEPPRVVELPNLEYPTALRQAGIDGAVTVTYVVDSLGSVEPGSIVVVSSDHPRFLASVREALGRARFSPGRFRGRAVRVLVGQTFRFATR